MASLSGFPCARLSAAGCRPRLAAPLPSSITPGDGKLFAGQRLISTPRGLLEFRSAVVAGGVGGGTVVAPALVEVLQEDEMRPLRVGLVCGGPSAERGISLNSARSVLDHIQGEGLSVSCYYIDSDLNAYAISAAQLYSNTPADFDFRLESLAQGFKSLSEFVGHLSSSVDIVFPVIHGRFGEDGSIQELLEKAGVPFVGTSSKSCLRAFDKYNASLELDRLGFATVPSFLIQENQFVKEELVNWFKNNNVDIECGKVVVKPARAGSSIGVKVAHGIDDATLKAFETISEGIDDRILVEVFLEGGKEFTAIVIDAGSTTNTVPIVLLPTEVELMNSENSRNVAEDTIFNYRRKYLPTCQVAYHTPPCFPTDVVDCIREGASVLFQKLSLQDFARIDGWFLPSINISSSSGNATKFGNTDWGTVLFTDINLISGMEQTSFLFQQASKVGFSHSLILQTIIRHACLRYPSLVSSVSALNTLGKLKPPRPRKDTLKNSSSQKVFVIFGGDTSERQVSLMSGTNVWLNLQGFDDLDVTPCLLAPTSSCFQDGKEDANRREVWTLPYSLVLRHTTEEVFSACIEAVEPDRASKTSQLCERVKAELVEAFSKHSIFSGFDVEDEPPVKFSLEQWIQHVKDAKAIVFIAIHGGIGEDGTLQSLLDAAGVLYTGPGAEASRICMDKVSTAAALSNLGKSGVHAIPKDVWRTKELLNIPVADTWKILTTKLQSETLCVKPARDGCSSGVARLCLAKDLEVYINALGSAAPRIPANCFSRAHGVIEMPVPPPESIIFEPFVETDDVVISHTPKIEGSRHLSWKGQKEWIEITVGVVGSLGKMRSLNPSITVKESGDILSLEEKFQGGTGINLTPPPREIIRDEVLQLCMERIGVIANSLGLEGFSRIDAFVNVRNGEVMVIEVNTVPGMTPSTVLIHQALAEQPPIYPRQFFRMLLDMSMERKSCAVPAQ